MNYFGNYNFLVWIMRLPRFLIVLLLTGIAGPFLADGYAANEYINSAHGNATYGVARPALLNATTPGFAVGNCAHCHEQHASVDGSEPAPALGVKGFMLFEGDNSGQSTNFCFNCHLGVGGYQDPAPVKNRSYSYRAGNYMASGIADIKTAFGLASSHDLADIVTFVTGNPPNWKYTANSNACAVCHDPHIVKGDPENLPNQGKSGGTRPGVITEVNSTSIPINLWGDSAAEKMNNYTASYTAPNCVTAGSEPDCDVVSNGSNLPNYVEFCSKCHFASGLNLNKPVYSTAQGGNMRDINWTTNVHGLAAAVTDIQVLPPYNPGSGSLGYVLSCLDCHEPHGSLNQSLLRYEINGSVTGVVAAGAFDQVCARCHNPNTGAAPNNWDDEHHLTTDAPYARGTDPNCGTVLGCHSGPGPSVNRIVCSECHYHGAVTNGPFLTWAGNIPVPTLAPFAPPQRQLF